ncbi:hypothetical protein AB0L33_30180 [Streptomyces sp. NPDC052299]|uniref:hypothetical protein n=1 Tax=Streptomyces sp. NPDC052299 TaxID=3155054 RepID=UPI00342CA1D3
MTVVEVLAESDFDHPVRMCAARASVVRERLRRPRPTARPGARRGRVGGGFAAEITWTPEDDLTGYLAKAVEPDQLAYALEALGGGDVAESGDQALLAAQHTTALARLWSGVRLFRSSGSGTATACPGAGSPASFWTPRSGSPR